MLLRKFSQTLRVSLALMLAVFSTGILPTATAYANHGGGQPQPQNGSGAIEWGQQGRDKNDPACEAGQTSLFHYVLAPSGTTLTAAGTINVTFSTGSGSDLGELSADDGGAGHYYVPASYDAVATAATVTGASWVTNNHNPQTPLLTLSHTECQGTATIVPAGELTVTVDCEEGSFSGVVTAPAGGVATYKVNGTLTTPGSYTNLQPGSYTVEMFVDGTLVDSKTVVVAACEDEQPPAPAGTLTVNVTCEAGSFSGAVTTPVSGTATYKVNGTLTTPGSYTNLQPGSYTVEMFVDGTLVDSKTVVVAACPPPDSESVTLCHATGSEKNPFVRITVSAEGAFNGHLGDDHQNGEDIIPFFTYNGETHSQNWTEGMVLTDECDVATEVTPAVVQFLNPTCENPTGRVVITATEGVTYKVGDTVVTGTVSYPGGTSVTVTAEASDESYVLDEEATTSWSHTFTAAPTGCVLGDNDVCPNIEGTQSVVPTGMIQNTMTGECFTPGGRGGVTPAAQVLGASTQALPETLPSTGGADSPLAIIIASILAYGAAYFLQGRRLLGRKEALSA